MQPIGDWFVLGAIDLHADLISMGLVTLRCYSLFHSTFFWDKVREGEEERERRTKMNQ